jgi:hypothetical protein
MGEANSLFTSNGRRMWKDLVPILLLLQMEPTLLLAQLTLILWHPAGNRSLVAQDGNPSLAVQGGERSGSSVASTGL